MTPLHITVEEAKARLREAYANRELAAQHSGAGAVYYHSATGSRCAIGCLFTRGEARDLEMDPGGYRLAHRLINDGDLVVDDNDWFEQVQIIHDRWANNTTDHQPFLEMIQ